MKEAFPVEKRKHPARAALAAVLAIVVGATCLIVPATAAQKISNPGNFSGIDGIDYDPDVGIHNSYAWCTEVFEQADADYLWVGMNRDFGAFLVGNSADDLVGGDTLLEIAGIPATDADKQGKIYRQKCADNDAEWELMYENPAISGWRRMIIFNGDLYVFAGLTNLSPTTLNFCYSIILRFRPDFEPGDKPEVVFWRYVPIGGAAPEYFRSAAILDGKLYVGTYDCKVFVTDGEGLTDLSEATPWPPPFPPQPPTMAPGWSLFKDLPTDVDVFESAGDTGFAYIRDTIWDMIGFNGYLYVFAIHLGFRVYKIDPSTGDMEVIVGGSESAKYPPGMGIPKNMSCSGYLSTAFGKDYVYISTFANGPGVIGNMGIGDMDKALNQVFCPSQMYRFDENDDWEVIVADTAGEFAPKDKAGNVIPRIGNQRSGFYPGCEVINPALNQYIWWMAEYDGKIYATTWDLSVFKRDFLSFFFLINMNVFSLKASDPEAHESIMQELLPMRFTMDTPLLEIISIGLKSIPVTLKTLVLMIKYRVFADLIPLWIDAIRVLFNFKNPGGFDLFVSEDGVNFEPVTVNGLGNEENYGGRVLLPSKYGLFLCTANPFGGGQVWRMDDIKPALTFNAPASIPAGSGPVTVSLQAMALGLAVDVPVLTVTGDNAEAALVARSDTIIYDYNNCISLSPILKRYNERYTMDEYNSEMFDIVLTDLTPGTLTLKVSYQGITATCTIEVIAPA